MDRQRRQKNNDGHRQVGREQDVEHHGRNRHDEHEDRADEHDRARPARGEIPRLCRLRFALDVVGGILSPPQSLVRRDGRSAHVLNFTRTRCPCLKRDRLRFRFGSGMEDHEFSYLDRSVIPWDVWRDDTADRRECPERITGLKGPDNVQKLRSNSVSACSGSASQEWIGLVVCPPLGQD